MIGIYVITNRKNDKQYVGQSSDIEWRWKHHKTDLRHDKHHNRHLQNAWKKYGEECFDFKILEECTLEELDEKEKKWIKELDTLKNGYNLDEGGKGIRGYKHTEEEIVKMRMIQNPKAVLQLDENLNVVKKWMSASHASKALKTQQRVIKSCCERKNYQKTAKGYFWVYEEDFMKDDFDKSYFVVNAQKPKTILQFDLDMRLIQEWESIHKAAKQTNIEDSCISAVCKYKRRTAGGYVWREKDNYTKELYEKDKDFDFHSLHTNKAKVKVAQFSKNGEFIKEFSSISQASKETKTNRGGINLCCNNKQKTANNFVWKYVN